MSKKFVSGIIIILLLFLLFLYFYNKPRSYEKNYKVNGYKIVENYNVINKNYKFIITIDDIDYPFLISKKYLNKRNLVKDIKIRDKNNTKCLLPESDYLDFYPLCSQAQELITLNVTDNDLKYNYYSADKKETKFDGNTIYDLYNNKYFIYNYRGFSYLGKENKNIQIYDKDYYDNNHIFQVNDYLIIAHIKNEYYIDSFIIINSSNGKKEQIELEEELSTKIRFLGDYKNKVYFIEEKLQKEYILDLKKAKVEEINGMILEENKFHEYKVSTIINKELKFTKKSIYNYQVISDKLYLKIANHNILLTNNYVTKIVRIADDSVYYLSNDYLYVYNLYDGDILLLNNFEWNFNNDNVIFIF